MRNAGLEEAQAGIKIAWRNINMQICRLDWLVLCDCGFQVVFPLPEMDKRLWKLPEGID